MKEIEGKTIRRVKKKLYGEEYILVFTDGTKLSISSTERLITNFVR